MPRENLTTSRKSTLEARLPEDWRIYAVGDIHGRADLVRSMSRLIATDLEHCAARNVLTVFLGDYIDRGMETRDVLGILSRPDFPTPILPLCGNHEAMLLDFLCRNQFGDTWIRNGGLETLHSYGVDTSDIRYGHGLDLAAAALLKALRGPHMDFLKRLRPSLTIGDYFFCHAGIRPGTPIDRQTEEDLLWIRQDFLSSAVQHEKIVVHGHTPVPAPEVRSNRINIDTGAYMTGRLTCLVLEGNARRFMTT